MYSDRKPSISGHNKHCVVISCKDNQIYPGNSFYNLLDLAITLAEGMGEVHLIAPAEIISKFSIKSQDIKVVSIENLIDIDSDIVYSDQQPCRSYAIYRYIQRNQFHVSHFAAEGGLGFYTALASLQGIIHTDVITHISSPTRWRRNIERSLPDLAILEQETMERIQSENSTANIVSSNAALNAIQKLGWQVSNVNYIPRSILPAFGRQNMTRGLKRGELKELIFIDSHENISGFDKLAHIIRELGDLSFNIVLLNNTAKINGEISSLNFLRELGRYHGKIDLLELKDAEELGVWLSRRNNALCIFPTTDRLTSQGLGECLAAGMPFIASDVGCSREVLNPESFRNALVPPTIEDFVNTIRNIAAEGQEPIKSIQVPRNMNKKFQECSNWSGRTVDNDVTDEPLVSVCITHRDRPVMLKRALEHLMQQTYNNIEIIIVDDGSTSDNTLDELSNIENKNHRFPICVHRTNNQYLGAARNKGAELSHGRYILFHDDDNFAEPNEVEVLVRAAILGGYDILTTHFWVVYEDNQGKNNYADRKIESYFLGGSSSCTFINNRFGDANALVKREIFQEIGGFSELVGVGLEDWELFIKAFFRGFKMGVVPEPLFNYSVRSNSMSRRTNLLANYERLFSTLGSEKIVFDPDLARMMSKEKIEKDIIGRTFLELENQIDGPVFREIIDLDTKWPDLARKLSNIMFMLRDNWVGLAPRIGERPALLISGWAHLGLSGGYIPKIWKIDRKFYETVVYFNYVRRDVNSAFYLNDDCKCGFDMILKPIFHLNNFRLGAKVGSSKNNNFRILDKIDRPLRAHIDDIITLPLLGSILSQPV